VVVIGYAGRGTVRARLRDMGVAHFTDLRAWQLANRLRIEIFQFTRLPPAVHDRRFCDDITAASASVCSNIAEGFGRYVHAEFAHFVTIARGSLTETQDHLLDAKARRYLKPEKFEELWSLSVDALRSVSGLSKYLKACRAPSDRGTTV
jgi:four helix bundle protein